MRVILVTLLVTMAISANGQNAQQCRKDIENQALIHYETRMLLLAIGGHILVLALNITILTAIQRFIKPIAIELQTLTFFVMDKTILTALPKCVRSSLGCKPEPTLAGILGGCSEDIGSKGGSNNNISEMEETSMISKVEKPEAPKNKKKKASKSDDKKKAKKGKK